MFKKILKYISPIKVFVALIVLATLVNVSFAQGAPGPAPTPEEFSEPAFSTKDLFPSWDEPDYRVTGVAGRNSGDKNKLFLGIVPTLIDLMMRFVAPVVFVMMVLSGLRFIYARENEEERSKAKKFFQFTVFGLMVIILSYSIMRALYFVYIG